MMRTKVCFAAMVFCLAVSQIAVSGVTDPNIISGVVAVNSAAAAPVIVKGGLQNGVYPFVDRTNMTFAEIGLLGKLDYIQTAVDDKADPDVQYQVTLDKPGTLFLFIDNRVGDDDMETPPTLGSGIMDWVGSAGFTTSGQSINIGTPATVYSLALTESVTTTLHAQNNGSTRVMYGIAAAPAGWNYVPAISGVPATTKVAPGETLTVDATVSDDGVPGTGLSVQWTTVTAPEGAEVTYTPNATSEDVTIAFSMEGIYTLKLSATDSEQTAEQTVQVTVAPLTFALQANQFVTVCNDSKTGPTSRVITSVTDIRNYLGTDGVTTRRRVSYYSYNIADVKREGKVFTDCCLKLRAKSRSSSGHIYVYGIKEEFDNFSGFSSQSWSTMPGVVNNPVPPLGSEITIDTLDKADVTPLLMTIMMSGTAEFELKGPSSALDEFLNADTDGTILLMFITYDPQNTDFEIYSPTDSRSDGTDTGLKGIILKGAMSKPLWATHPAPANNTSVSTSLTTLGWNNPEPNQPGGIITCDVYLGTTDPNTALPDYGYTTLAAGITGESIAIPAGLLQTETIYYWIVDVHDSTSSGVTRGYVWSFNTNNKAPVVTTSAPQYIWLNNAGDPSSASATLTGSATDDGYPAPFSLLWELVSGPGAATIDSNTSATTAVTLPIEGDYVFRLIADDTDQQGIGLTEIIVRATPCLAAQAMPGYTAIVGDFNSDCFVNLEDFSTFASHWLECNSLAPCE
ncbi:MAG: hypothetical protein JXB18_04645 [Sedimentisphaerales bacterium]|nr:hypothetical protein [Sedimentisphaerales bacterium]